MKTKYFTILFLLLIIGCTNKKTQDRNTKTNQESEIEVVENQTLEIKKKKEFLSESIRIDGDSIVIPEFEIEVQLSNKAEAKIERDKESIIVQAYFSGIPKDTLNEDYEKWGKVHIGSEKKELWNSNVAEFRNVKISKTAYEELSDLNFEVLINVFTGKHSSTSNLLDCEILQEGINEVKGKRHQLKGKLIYGE